MICNCKLFNLHDCSCEAILAGEDLHVQVPKARAASAITGLTFDFKAVRRQLRSALKDAMQTKKKKQWARNVQKMSARYLDVPDQQFAEFLPDVARYL
ncbi:hypothetical protein PLEOSDRAFT_152553 [Pleurotus ostreatus PC15]|uniref:Uncharacterized protein n=1 Tax=Pleurotus ostreatus (strain PC15) TaxID=1137138 RepID=A0A067P0X4_PLEO1|nr:hypothetical protein PLEOSDRAFT_152553 [Pleurotus ostreatus PC15]